MKTCWVRSVFVIAGIVASVAFANGVFAAQQLAVAQTRILERGPHHRKVMHVSQTITPDGQTVLKTNRYTELGGGLCRKNEFGQWVDARDVIEIVPGGALASQTGHSVRWAANANTWGAVDMFTPDGRRLRSHVLGLAYMDAGSGQSVIIAEIKDSIGVLVGDNQVLYADAFSTVGDFKADIQYLNTLAGLEQNIILRPGVSPPSPAVFGLNPETTRLEVLTEFVEAPAPTVVQRTISSTTHPAQRAQMVQPDFVDQRLEFGGMIMMPGHAFPIGGSEEPRSIQCGKTWEQRAGRVVLVEAVPYPAIKPHLDALGANAAVNQPDAARMAKVGRSFPSGPSQGRVAADDILMAALPKKDDGSGFNIDYTLLTSGVTNYVFSASETFFCPGSAILLWGTPVLEGGVCIKFTNNIVAPQLHFVDAIDCQTSPYRPAIATGMNDDTVGATISGSTGNPWTNYCGIMMYFGVSTGRVFSVHDVHVSHAFRAFFTASQNTVDIHNCQVNHALGAFGNNEGFLNVRNVLVNQATFGFTGVPSSTNTGENVTFYAISNLVASNFPAPSIDAPKLTNCLLIAVTNGFTNFVGTRVETNASPAGIFQTVGQGSFYLAENSPYRNAGTTNINPTLLGDLRQRTTYPPIWLTNLVTNTLTLAPTVLRDTDTPDLGWHPDCLDFFVSGLRVTNATLALTNGVALAIDYSATNWGIILQNAQLFSCGNPTNLNRIVRAHNVQEKSSGNPVTRALFYDGSSSGPSNELRMRFTFFSQLADDGNMLSSGRNFSALEWTHSVICNPSLVVDTAGGNYLTCAQTNSVWERGRAQFGLSNSSANVTIHTRNNLFRNFSQHFFDGKSTWTVNDNLIDGGTGLDDHGTALTNICNAYYQASTNLSGGTSNLALGSLSYVTGPLSTYYQPTNSSLIHTGSITADLVGLYHFTSTTNNSKETNSVVTIGPHWVALDANNNLIDSDIDGLVDYEEDRNGNGSRDGSETDWQLADTDNDGFNDYTELYVSHSDPLDAYSLNKAANGRERFKDAAWLSLVPMIDEDYVAGDTMATLSIVSYNSGTPATITLRIDGAAAGKAYEIYFSPIYDPDATPWTIYSYVTLASHKGVEVE